MDRALNIGVIGAGVISHAYLRTIARSPALKLKALSSLGMESAREQARRYGGVAQSTEVMLADPEIDIVVNLAPPAAHHALGVAVLHAGKHLYSEKPLATCLSDASALLSAAEARALKVGCAPDTFLGPAHQQTRALIDAGAIGRVVGGAAVMASNGMEHWHPNPAFFYSRGGGPLLDIGPYMVTQLVNLLGAVKSVSAIGSMPRYARIVSSPPRAGERIEVEVPTTVNGVLRFESGADVAMTLSWDVLAHQRNAIELYGLDGTIVAPTPNNFDGDVRLFERAGGWKLAHEGAPALPPAPGFASLVDAVAALRAGIDPMTGGPLGPASPPLFGDRRGLGLIDMAASIREGREARANGRLAFHVLEVLLALQTSAEDGGSIDIVSRVDRPAAYVEGAAT